MLLRLLRYDTELVYTKEKEMFIADTLSKAYLPNSDESGDQFAQIYSVCHLRINPESLQELRDATRQNDDMITLKYVILNDWLDTKQETQTTPYFAFRNELAVYDGLIFSGERVIVPKSMRKNMKERLHNSHLGCESMPRCACEWVYWPGITTEIRQIFRQA